MTEKEFLIWLANANEGDRINFDGYAILTYTGNYKFEVKRNGQTTVEIEDVFFVLRKWQIGEMKPLFKLHTKEITGYGFTTSKPDLNSLEGLLGLYSFNQTKEIDDFKKFKITIEEIEEEVRDERTR